jgi:NAD(P)-dependent dehydrogenase (short-subunit alcohol dehydrogenase family)
MSAPAAVTIVTGATGLIGSAVVRRLARPGVGLVLACRERRWVAESLSAKAEEKGARVKIVVGDLCDGATLAALTEAADALGRLNGLVALAAEAGERKAFFDLTPAEIERVWRTNIHALFLTCQSAAGAMARSRGGNGGSIVIFSSQAAETGGFRLAPYAASKGAADTLTVSLASELGEEGIRVNAVAPGVICAPEAVPPELAERMRRSAPLGRVGAPEEAAALVDWLLGPDSSYITGAVIPLTGGRRA